LYVLKFIYNQQVKDDFQIGKESLGTNMRKYTEYIGTKRVSDCAIEENISKATGNKANASMNMHTTFKEIVTP